jgi:hypothetical protein
VTVAGNWQGSFGGTNLGLFASYHFADSNVSGVEDRNHFQVGGRVGFMGFDIDGSYGNESSATGTTGRHQFWNAGIGTEIGGVAAGFTMQSEYFRGGRDDEQTYIVSAHTPILPGVTLRGDVGYKDTDDSGAFLTLMTRVDF